MASPQKENGFTAIANEILENIVKTPLLGSEYQVLFFIIRKTYGYQKREDIISLSQFQKCTGLSRPTVVKTIKNLVSRRMIVKICLPGARISFRFNKDYEEWVVNTSKLVKGKWVTSKDVLTETSKDVLTHKRKKESNTKESTTQSVGGLGNEVIYLFKEVNPSYKSLFPRAPQHRAAERLIETHGFDRVKKVVGFLASRMGDRYCPTITTPTQLENKWAALEKYAVGLKANVKNQNVIW